ncbi:MAG: trypsin-like peptidase domain-containing protein [Lachnospiraceae bacterium]|nr:trypsin-like peptidase domain-containing protein [Lachnospiraceae bacterium]
MNRIKKILLGIVLVAVAAGTCVLVYRAPVWSNKLKTAYTEKKAPSPTPEAGKVRVSAKRMREDLNKVNIIRYTDEASVLLLDEIDIASIAEAVLPSIVSVDCKVTYQDMFGRRSEGQTSGTGIFIESKEGLLYLVTNHHVVEGATAVTITFADGESYPCSVKNSDAAYDLAILTLKESALKESTREAVKPATLAESKEVHVGDMAIAVGNALGFGSSVTVGYIGATDHRYSSDSVSLSLIQTDAAINPGNSGGALVNIEGEVIGINSSKLAATDIEGIGFAIPMTVAVPIIRDLEQKERIRESEQGFLGVYIAAITDEQINSLGWPAGIYIKEIIEGGAASESDLAVGDIITEVNGVPVATNEQLQSRISSYRYGTVITLTVQRMEDGVYKPRYVDVTLKERKSD